MLVSLFNKVAGPRPVTLLKKRFCHRCFPMNFVKFLRIPFFIEHLQCDMLFFDRLFSYIKAYKFTAVIYPLSFKK